jgi:hypothetical protein
MGGVSVDRASRSAPDASSATACSAAVRTVSIPSHTNPLSYPFALHAGRVGRMLALTAGA